MTSEGYVQTVLKCSLNIAFACHQCLKSHAVAHIFDGGYLCNTFVNSSVIVICSATALITDFEFSH